MNTYIIRSAAEAALPYIRRERRALLSYSAQGNILMSESIPPGIHADAMIIASDSMDTHISPSIYDECRRRDIGAVFLDANDDNSAISDILAEVSSSLHRRGLSVFCPLFFADSCPLAVPVAECSVSGGELAEYLRSLLNSSRRLALSIPRRHTEFSMPVFTSSGRTLTAPECRRTIDRYDARVFYSPQMVCNYFIYSPEPESARFVLFDDARTLSEKLRIARRLGISDVFLAYREISDIAEDIML